MHKSFVKLGIKKWEHDKLREIASDLRTGSPPRSMAESTAYTRWPHRVAERMAFLRGLDAQRYVNTVEPFGGYSPSLTFLFHPMGKARCGLDCDHRQVATAIENFLATGDPCYEKIMLPQS